MFNGVMDSRQVRAQKSTQSSQSSGVSSTRRRSEEELEIIRLKEALRQRDEYYGAYLTQQTAMLQILHTPGQDGASASNVNELDATTQRGSAQNSNQPSEGCE
ncbi:hypothetical protein ABZP36_001538 [Zizania latifolia]